MSTWLVAFKQWPVFETERVGQLVSEIRGGVWQDWSRAIVRGMGILHSGLSQSEAEDLARVLTQDNVEADAFPEDLVPPLPRPRMARKIDFTDETALHAQVGYTGPPESVPWEDVLLLSPALHIEKTVKQPEKKKKGMLAREYQRNEESG